MSEIGISGGPACSRHRRSASRATGTGSLALSALQIARHRLRSNNLHLALHLRYEGQEATGVVVRDPPQNLVARARLLYLGYENRQRLCVARLLIISLQRVRIGEIRRKQEMVGVTRIDQRHDNWHHLIVVWTALTIKPNERPTLADGAVHLRIRVNKVSEVTDDDVLRVDTDVLEDVELLEGRLPRNARVRENRDVRCKVGTANGAKHLALILCDVVP
jgi:hypothetical protein